MRRLWPAKRVRYPDRKEANAVIAKISVPPGEGDDLDFPNTRCKPGQIDLGRWLATAVLFVFIVIVLGNTCALAIYGSSFLPRNFNEGWNAFHSQSFFDGGLLYHGPSEWVVNNYPPLSFILTAFVMHAGLDAMFAGRLIAGIAFLLLCILIGTITYSQRKNALAAVLALALFDSGMTMNYSLQVFANEPQILAQAIMMTGLYVILAESGNRFWSRWGLPCLSAVLMTTGVFIKHNPVAIIVAVAVWLLLTNRRRFVVFAATGILLGAIGAAICLYAFGHDFITSLLTPRVYSARKAWVDLLALPAPIISTLLLCSVIFFVRRRDNWRTFLIVYLLSALAIGLLQSLGEGVNSNAYFEVVMAIALSGGYVVSSVAQADFRRWFVVAFCGASLWCPGLSAAKDIFLFPSWKAELDRKVDETRRVSAFVANIPGRTFCETAIFCYWAGKTFEYDQFIFQEGLHSGRFTDAALIDRMQSGYFKLLVINNPETNIGLTPKIFDAIHVNFDLILETVHERVYVRK